MRFRFVVLTGLVFFACSSEDTPPGGETPRPDAGASPVFEPTPGAWSPADYVVTPRAANPRGFLDRKGLVHAHSAHSHDACDGKPKDDNGVFDAACIEQFKTALCTTKLDFVFLSDHRESFADIELRDAFLVAPERGDTFVERNGGPVAAWSVCPGQDPAMVLAGSEVATMPVGFERPLAGTPAERGAALDLVTAEGIEAFKAAGAVSLVQHTEDWTVDQLTTLPFDGFEMFNLHANAVVGAGQLVGLLGKLDDEGVRLPHPNLVFFTVVSEDPRYLSTWGSVLARGVKRATTMGTDCHRNTFRQILADGDRIDSYRRMMGWFSNHLLVRPDAGGSFDDLGLKDALRSGRLYGAFDMLGAPVGFDFHATQGGAIHEMGEEVTLAEGATLHVAVPTLDRPDPKVTAPEITARLLRAREGGWDVVATSALGETAIDFAADAAGAYRAEIRMKPRHLKPYLGDDEALADRADVVWIYANAIYVR